MQQYNLSYSSKNTYEKEVWGAYLKFLIHPFAGIGIQIKNPQLHFNVQGDWWMSHARQKDITEIFFKSNTKFLSFEIQYQVQVIVPTINPFEREWLSEKQEQSMVNSPRWTVDNYRYLFLSEHRPKSFLNPSDCMGFTWKKQGGLLDKILHLRDQVYVGINFISGVTNTNTCAQEIIQTKKGVCQDFAHVFLGLLRNFGVASRYASGYLHQGEGIRGASQLHAWVECHLPNVGWIGIDPTNKLLIDQNYIKICHGYDYDDCLPVSGVVNSLAQNQSSEYQVKVQQIQ